MLGPVRPLFRSLIQVTRDLAVLVVSAAIRSRARLAAENLFLRKQLAMYQERSVKPRRTDNATRITLVVLSRFLECRQLLTVVAPQTFIGWHRKGFRLFWRWQSRPRGRPPIPTDVQQLIVRMATANRTWGEERIAAELLVKLGVRLSPRTVRRYMPSRPPRERRRTDTQAWSTFVRNHSRAVLASDFFAVVTATFRTLYVFVVLEVETRRILQWNVTAHPTADWTVQQFRRIVLGDHGHRFVIHDRDSVTERHLRVILREWVRHCNRGRPHSSLGPGLPDPPGEPVLPSHGHQLPVGHRVVATPILGGLHHEYRLEVAA
jgi:hypothetical protein